MAASDVQLARTRAQRFEREYRVLVGYTGAARAYLDNSLFVLGEPVTLPAETRTTAEVFAQTATIPVLSTAGYSAPGVFILRAGTPWAGWYTYTGLDATNFTGARFLRGHGHHYADATVGVWDEITDLVDRPAAGNEWDDGAFYLWQYELAGRRYSSNRLPPDSAVLILERLTPHPVFGEWTEWLVAAQGYVRDWYPVADYTRAGRWTATVESLYTYLNQHEVAGRRYGAVNLAANASVTASPNLTNPAAELDEWRGSFGSTEAESVTDELLNTLYISEVTPSVDDEEPGSSGGADPGVLIDEVFAWPRDEQPADLQYIALRLAPDSPEYDSAGISLDQFVLTTSQTVYRPAIGAPGWPDEVEGGGFYIRLKGITLTADNPRVILCRNASIFHAWFGIADNTPVVDWRFLGGFSLDHLPAQDVSLSPDGDVIHLRYTQGAQYVRDMVAWGDIGGDVWSGAEDEDESADQWNDPSTVDVPAQGSSIRRVPTCLDTNTVSDWDEEPRPMPGDSRTETEEVFISVELPLIPTVLAEDMTDTAPGAGEWLSLSDASYLDASGTILIDSERISYSSRSDEAIKILVRGAGGTTPAAHDTDAPVSRFSTDYPGLGAHRLPTVEAVELRRWHRTFYALGDRAIPIMPQRYRVWGSVNADPLLPGDADYHLDWVTGGELHSSNSSINVFSTRIRIPIPPQPLRHVMLVIHEMNDGGRAKLNEMLVWRRQVGGAINGEGGVGQIVRDLLEEVLAPAAITILPGTFTGTSPDLTVSSGTLASILQTMAEEYGFKIRMTRDGRVEVGRAPTHPLGPRPEVVATFDATMMRSPASSSRRSRIRLGQVVVELADAKTGERIVGRYPPAAGPGVVKKVQMFRAAPSQQQAALIAQARYLADDSTSGDISFRTVGPAEWLNVGDRILVPDYADEAKPNGELVNRRVTSITRGGDAGIEEITAVEWRMP